MKDVNTMKEKFESIPPKHLSYMKYNYKERIKRLEECIDVNFQFLCQVVSKNRSLFDFKQIVLFTNFLFF